MNETEKALVGLILRLLECAELNQDDIEPDTSEVIDEVEEALVCLGVTPCMQAASSGLSPGGCTT